MRITKEQQQKLSLKAEELFTAQTEWRKQNEGIIPRGMFPIMWFVAGAVSPSNDESDLMRSHDGDGFMMYALNEETNGEPVKGINATYSTWEEIVSYLTTNGINLS